MPNTMKFNGRIMQTV